MLLSEAIKLGSLLGPQLNNCGLVGPNQSSCAIGAALLALGVPAKDESIYYLVAEQYFPVLGKWIHISTVGLPSPFKEQNRSILSLIWMLNDYCKWPRERIADWLIEHNLDCESVDPMPSPIEALAEAVVA